MKDGKWWEHPDFAPPSQSKEEVLERVREVAVVTTNAPLWKTKQEVIDQVATSKEQRNKRSLSWELGLLKVVLESDLQKHLGPYQISKAL
ncbi:hypothetical protein LOK49_LG02G02816 [Camellia lanceoleosa]|uniref:Uncharacterized protein n=1 Tax=Camellia lanceoleosa TaxID=1840588 RepID=A0ACC0IN72_9ERIC|nr:hypothetical protein LOK49_LG02G02816 [Camellia lanceoleosa]